MRMIDVKNISKTFDADCVFKNVSLHVDKGEMVSVLGRSGVGKTTLFNIIAGLIPCESGMVDIQGSICYMQQRDLCQNFLSVVDNIALPLRVRGVSRKEARKTVAEYLEIFGLGGCAKMYPQQLSGGMRQRAALLRTYLMKNGDSVMLLDEPFSALDDFTKQELYAWYKEISRKFELTTMLITHNEHEARELSDRIYVMTYENDGAVCRPFKAD